MSLLDHALKAARALERAELRYALVGGLACILMGVRRMTEDADFIVEAKTMSEVRRLVSELRREGLPVVEGEAEAAFRERGHFTIVTREGRLDFKFASSPLDFETLKRAVEVRVRGELVRIARLEENIAAKLLVLRSLKDLEDAFWLMVEYWDTIDWARLRELMSGDPLRAARELLEEVERELGSEAAVRSKLEELKSYLNRLRR
ncbi:MAG: hypothetical protein DRK00_08115 [Thermoprotei archaeon]|nr:MAG: hypothetical protein DRK00_08115 [Thermoprotei archaeon]